MSKRLEDLTVLAAVSVVSSAGLWMSAGMKTIYQNYDGPYYAVVARCLYDKECISRNFSFPLPLEYYPAHFPLFPVLMKLLQPLGLLRSGVLINLLASVGGAVAIYLIWEKMKWGNGLFTASVWLFMWPRMWVVRSVASPETLFILLILLSLYMFTQKKFFWAGVWGAAATLTKSPGILLFVSYCLWFLGERIRSKKWRYQIWPVGIIPLALAGLFLFFYFRTGDFWAYFNSGDNIHLQVMPFGVFDSQRPWVGTFWLEDVLWIYLIGTIGVVRAFKRSTVWGWYGLVFLGSIFFVSHRDISRYSLPLVPVVLLGLSELIHDREVRKVLLLMLTPMFLYSLNFLKENSVAIADWGPFL